MAEPIEPIFKNPLKFKPFGIRFWDFVIFAIIVTLLVLVSIGIAKQEEHKKTEDCNDAAALEAGQVFSPFFNRMNWLYAFIGFISLVVFCVVADLVRRHVIPKGREIYGNIKKATAKKEGAEKIALLTESDEGADTAAATDLEEFADLSTLSSLSTLSRQVGDVTEINSISDIMYNFNSV